MTNFFSPKTFIRSGEMPPRSADTPLSTREAAELIKALGKENK